MRVRVANGEHINTVGTLQLPVAVGAAVVADLHVHVCQAHVPDVAQPESVWVCVTDSHGDGSIVTATTSVVTNEQRFPVQALCNVLQGHDCRRAPVAVRLGGADRDGRAAALCMKKIERVLQTGV
jgi:hypothetical protein